jgi:hypothetical protein
MAPVAQACALALVYYDPGVFGGRACRAAEEHGTADVKEQPLKPEKANVILNKSSS